VFNNKSFLGIIPARGGSKRLKKKNILNLKGKPLIVWSIEAAQNSKYIDKLVVTSDNKEILNIAKKCNTDVIARPSILSGDAASSFDTIRHTLNTLARVSENYDYLILLQPTSPLRNEKHIDNAIEFLEKKNADAIISVCETDHNPLWSNTLDDSLSMKDFLNNDVKNKRSQDFEKYYRLNGAIYICKVSKFLEQNGFFLKDKIYAFKMDRKSSIDIDDKIDFMIAETLIEKIDN